MNNCLIFVCLELLAKENVVAYCGVLDPGFLGMEKYNIYMYTVALYSSVQGEPGIRNHVRDCLGQRIVNVKMSMQI